MIVCILHITSMLIMILVAAHKYRRRRKKPGKKPEIWFLTCCHDKEKDT